MTTPSPKTIGMMLTRRSISRPCTLILKLPSCGTRRSAMLRFERILMRLMMAAWSCRICGGTFVLRRMPSTR